MPCCVFCPYSINPAVVFYFCVRETEILARSHFQPLFEHYVHGWQDDHGDLSSVNMDTAVAIRTLEATYKTSADATAVETMILKLTEKVHIHVFCLSHRFLIF